MLVAWGTLTVVGRSQGSPTRGLVQPGISRPSHQATAMAGTKGGAAFCMIMEMACARVPGSMSNTC